MPRGTSLTCLHCGRTIYCSAQFGRASYSKHVNACGKRTPAERIAANRELDRKQEKKNAEAR